MGQTYNLSIFKLSMRAAIQQKNILRAYSKNVVTNFIEIVNCGVFSTIPLGLWHIEI